MWGFSGISLRRSVLRPYRVETLERRRLLSVTPNPFEHVIIDPNPGVAPLEKALGDINGDGKLDAIVGHSNAPGAGGIVWYRFPPSGNPTDPWAKYTIATGGQAYEQLIPYDM